MEFYRKKTFFDQTFNLLDQLEEKYYLSEIVESPGFVEGQKLTQLFRIDVYKRQVFTGMSAETRLYQSIADESSDGIYVIGKQNYELYYVNDNHKIFSNDQQLSLIHI